MEFKFSEVPEKKYGRSVLKKSLSIVLAMTLLVPTGIISATNAYAIETSSPLEASKRGDYDTLLDLNRLPVIANVMYAGGHPDDESNSSLVYFYDKYLADTAYADANWGEGGENALGKEQYAALGVLRSQELRSARLFDKAKQFYIGQYDFGYSTSIAESLVNTETGEKGIYDPNVFTYNFVKIIRTMRPDVIASGHRYLNMDHGQHQATGYEIVAAMNAAADPKYIVRADDGKPLVTWQVKRYFSNWRAKNALSPRDGEGNPDLITPANEADPYFDPAYVSNNAADGKPVTLSEHTYAQWGNEGRNNHKSQKMTGLIEANTGEGKWKLFKGAPGFDTVGSLTSSLNNGTMLAGIDTSILRINQTLSKKDKSATQANVRKLKDQIDSVVKDFDINNQVASVSVQLNAATATLKELEEYSGKISATAVGKQDFARYLSMIRDHITKFTEDIYGITLVVSSDNADPTPGQTITVTAKLLCDINQSGKVKFPTNLMTSKGVPTVIAVPKGFAVKADSNKPTAISETDFTGGKLASLKGYAYKYRVTIPEAYKSYTGPFNAPYNEAYTNKFYPYGASNYNPADWAKTTKYAELDTSKFASRTGEPKPKNMDGKINLGITTNPINPYSVPIVAGKLDYSIDGSVYKISAEPDLRLTPKVSVIVDNDSMMYRHTGQNIVGELNVIVRSGIPGIVKVDLSGEASEPGITVNNTSVTLDSKGEEVTAKMLVTIPGNFVGAPKITVKAKYDGEEFTEGYSVIKYDHIISQNYYKKAVQNITVAEYKLSSDDIRIGFIATGIDDIVYDYIKGMYTSPEKANTNLKKLGAADISKSASELKAQFDTIVVGKTAFQISNKDLGMRESYKNLLEFADQGGNLVVHYQNFQGSEKDNIGYEWPSDLNGKMPLAPEPFKLVINGPGNINDENCPVTVDPENAKNPFFTSPNAIDLKLDSSNKSGSDVWNGWIQQRCEWTPGDPTLAGQSAQIDYVKSLGYKVLFQGHDPGDIDRPAVLYMDREAGGHYTYSAVVWDRQLVDLVPGAYELYANLLSMGYTPKN